VEELSDEDYNAWKRDKVTKRVAKDIEEQIVLFKQGAIELYSNPVKIAKLKGKVEACEEFLNWLKG